MDLDLFRFSHGIKPASADALPRKCIDCVGALHPRDGGWPLPTAGGRRHTHLPQRAPSDQTCLLQSGQKTKTSKLKCGRQRDFQGRPDSLVFGLWTRTNASSADGDAPTAVPAARRFVIATT